MKCSTYQTGCGFGGIVRYLSIVSLRNPYLMNHTEELPTVENPEQPGFVGVGTELEDLDGGEGEVDD